METPRATHRPSSRRLHAAIALAGAAVAFAGLAQANDAALESCRQESVAAQRLACYDAIPTRQPAAAGPAPVVPAAAGAVAPAAAPAPAAAASRFGLPDPRAPSGEAVESRISGRFEGWGPNTRFTLANGQVWAVEDGSNAALWLDSPAVRVRRGFAGAYYMEVAGTNRSPRVRRLQ